MGAARAFPLIALCLAAPACRGMTPKLYGTPEQGISSVIIGGRIVLPTGETRVGTLHINLENEGLEGRVGDVYRIEILPQQALLYQIEPGTYHLSPTRTAFGNPQPMLRAEIEGRVYHAPFPRDILRRSAIVVKPRKIVAIGILEARLRSAIPGREYDLRFTLDESVETRRQLVQKVVRDMMDPAAPPVLRESAIAWTRALDQTLNEILAESQRAPLYKRAP